MAPVAHCAAPMAIARARSAPRAARPVRAGAAVACSVHLRLQSVRRTDPPPIGHAHHTVAGYWFLDDPNERLSSEIADFLTNGDPPVAIGFWQHGTGGDRTTTPF
jgi:hypothetical protein